MTPFLTPSEVRALGATIRALLIGAVALLAWLFVLDAIIRHWTGF